MRKELFYNPRLLCERLGVESARRHRLAKLRGTVAASLELGHIDSLELLELCRSLRIATIYDIGANVGTWSLLAKAVMPEAVVHAFEPLAGCHDRFHANLKGIRNVHLHKTALGREDTTATMYLGEVTDTSSLLPPGPKVQEQPAATIELPVRALDSFVRENSLPPADLLKLDVQGFELEVLAGSVDTLDSASAVICEVSFTELYHGQCLFGDVVSFLGARGFGVHAFGAETARGMPLVQADVLFLRAATAR
jgi:FkbM family methyltransferase